MVVKIPCNLCGGNETRRLFEKEGFTFVQCRRCSFIYVNPKLTQEETKRVYLPEYYQERQIAQESPFFTRIYQKHLRFIQQYKRNGTLLDIGCGTGYFLYLAYKEGWQVAGVEISISSVQKIKENYGIEAFPGELHQANFEGNFFDVVTLWHVLEHLAEPKAVLSEIARILHPKGLLAMATPNLSGMSTDFLGQKSRIFNPKEHLYYYTPETLCRLLRRCGFRVLKVRTQNLYLYNIVSTVVPLFRGKRSQDNQVQAIYNQAFKMFQNPVSLSLLEMLNFLLNLFHKGDELVVYAEKN